MSRRGPASRQGDAQRKRRYRRRQRGVDWIGVYREGDFELRKDDRNKAAEIILGLSKRTFGNRRRAVATVRAAEHKLAMYRDMDRAKRQAPRARDLIDALDPLLKAARHRRVDVEWLYSALGAAGDLWWEFRLAGFPRKRWEQVVAHRLVSAGHDRERLRTLFVKYGREVRGRLLSRREPRGRNREARDFVMLKLSHDFDWGYLGMERRRQDAKAEFLHVLLTAVGAPVPSYTPGNEQLAAESRLRRYVPRPSRAAIALGRGEPLVKQRIAAKVKDIARPLERQAAREWVRKLKVPEAKVRFDELEAMIAKAKVKAWNVSGLISLYWKYFEWPLADALKNAAAFQELTAAGIEIS